MRAARGVPWMVLGGLVLGGCAVGPEHRVPPPPELDGFPAEASELLTTTPPESEWWRVLGDELLGRLVDEALVANHDLRIARANVAAARALLGEGRLNRYPIVTSGASVTRRQLSAETATFPERRGTVYDTGLDAAWELDFFGGVRRDIEALTADYQAAAAERRNVQVTVAAEVARTYMELRGAQYRLRVARRNADNQTATFKLTQDLLEGGRGTALDEARARAQLESTLASIPPLETEVARAVHRLGVLTGETPSALADALSERAPLPAMPERVAIGEPADLLRRRPDIQAAERRLAAATARVGVATAELFPRVSLAGSYGFVSLDGFDIGDSRAERWEVGPVLSWPAFDLGRVRARLRAAGARSEAALAAYEQAVLLALEETDNALVQYVQARFRAERLRIAALASEDAAQLARVRYQYGVDSFLTVLDAERRLLEVQDQLALGETESGLALVAVYKALGGGWQAGEE